MTARVRRAPRRVSRLLALTALPAGAVPAAARADGAAGQISGTVSLDPPLTAELSFTAVSAWSPGPAEGRPSSLNSVSAAPAGSFTIGDIPPGEYLVSTLGMFARLW